MRTFLFTWNPKRWTWENLSEVAAETIAGRVVEGGWTCGNRKYILPNERMFLIKLREEPRGIIGNGWVTSEPYWGRHWDKAKAKAGKKCLRVDGEWERLIDPNHEELLPLSHLLRGKLGNFCWTPQASGVEIPPSIANELEKEWAKHIGTSNLGTVFADEETSAFEGEERIAFIRHRKREQRLREAKIAETRKIGKGRLKCEVPRCGFDFEANYGYLGRGYAQVHHLKPLADRTRPSQTKLEDLVIVCANCHAMIHRGGKCRPLDKLIP